MKRHGEIIVSYLWKNFQVSVGINESGWEGVLLHHEEIDQELIPEEELTRLPDPMLFHMTTFEDEKENEWLTDTTELKYYTRGKDKKVVIHKAFLGPYLDMFNGEILSYRLSKKPNAKAVLDSLSDVIE